MQEIEAVVSGKVTGVSYRDFVQRKAHNLWLTGTVQNVGHSVKVVAQGSEDKLKTFIAHLHKGSFMTRVRDVSVVWREPTEQYKDFKILY